MLPIRKKNSSKINEHVTKKTLGDENLNQNEKTSTDHCTVLTYNIGKMFFLQIMFLVLFLFLICCLHYGTIITTCHSVAISFPKQLKAIKRFTFRGSTTLNFLEEYPSWGSPKFSWDGLNVLRVKATEPEYIFRNILEI